MTKNKPSKSIRIFIRKEKSRIRHTTIDLTEKEKLIGELQDRFHQS
jgi:hypothetical protein